VFVDEGALMARLLARLATASRAVTVPPPYMERLTRAFQPGRRAWRGGRPAEGEGVTSNTEPIVRYEILVEGILDDHWSAWFNGLEVSGDADVGITAIAGPLPDQAALHGRAHQDSRSRPPAA
jgi:hypothetical protein